MSSHAPMNSTVYEAIGLPNVDCIIEIFLKDLQYSYIIILGRDFFIFRVISYNYNSTNYAGTYIHILKTLRVVEIHIRSQKLSYIS